MKYVFRGKQQLNALKINRNAVLVTSGVLLFSVLGDEDGNHQGGCSNGEGKATDGYQDRATRNPIFAVDIRDVSITAAARGNRGIPESIVRGSAMYRSTEIDAVDIICTITVRLANDIA